MHNEECTSAGSWLVPHQFCKLQTAVNEKLRGLSIDIPLATITNIVINCACTSCDLEFAKISQEHVNDIVANTSVLLNKCMH